MPTAVVVGAGVGGLAVAGALARRDWQVTLLERTPRLRGDNAALMLWPYGLEALHRLGLGAGLDAVATPVPERGIRRPDGQWLVRPDDAALAAADLPSVVHREDLHDALIAGIGGRVEIRTGVDVKVVRRSAGQVAAVGDGETTWEADLVVGADGVDSVLRRRLAPESAVVAGGFAAWRAVIPWYRASELLGLLDRVATGGPSGETVGDGHRFRYAVLGQRGSAGASTRGGIYWTATVPGAARPESPVAQLGLLRRWFAEWHAPISDLLAATDPGELIQQDVSAVWPVPRAFAFHAGGGGYALLGDAAHAMAHHLAAGACLALEDAATLVDLVATAAPGPALRAALDNYTQRRRPTVLRLGRQSRRVGAVLVAPRGAARTRDAALGIAPGLMGRASHAILQFRRP